jgi:hypothetical protein
MEAHHQAKAICAINLKHNSKVRSQTTSPRLGPKGDEKSKTASEK